MTALLQASESISDWCFYAILKIVYFTTGVGIMV